MVVVGGEHINMFGDVMKTVDEISDDMSRLPESVFVFLNDEKYTENIFSKDNRHVSSPTLVKGIHYWLSSHISSILIGLCSFNKEDFTAKFKTKTHRGKFFLLQKDQRFGFETNGYTVQSDVPWDIIKGRRQ